jgi:hypothetical protein
MAKQLVAKFNKRFVKAPPQRSMRRRSPNTAPRLFEWLADQGYVEPVTTYRRKSDNRKATRGKSKRRTLVVDEE